MLKIKFRSQLGLFFFSLCLLSFLLTPRGYSDATISETTLGLTWSRVFERPYEQKASQFLPTTDGGYLLGGSTSVDSGDINQHLWLIKTDSEGQEEWNQTYQHHLKPGCHARSIIQTPDGGYALAGIASASTDYFSWDVWVVKTNANGIEQWNRTYNGLRNGPDYAGQIQVAPDGGFLIGGATQAYTAGTESWDTDFWLIKTDANGIEEWNKTYHRIGSDQGFALVPLQNDNFLLSGLSRDTAASGSPFSVWIIKIDENGTIIWDKTYSTGSNGVGTHENNLIETTDGGFLLVSYPIGNRWDMGKDYWIVKADSTGEIEWTTSFGDNYYDTPGVCLQNPMGEYYIGGAYNSPSGSQEAGDMCLVKLNSSGDVLWYKTYGDVTTGEKIVDMVLTEGPDSSEALVVFGFVESTAGASNRDFWLGKFEKVEETTTTTPSWNALLLPLSLFAMLSWRQRKKKS